MVNNRNENTETFVAKVTKTRNSKNKNYFIYRLNVPNQVAEKLDIGENDYLLLKAKKAQWYHLMNWSEAKNTWIKLPQDIKERIIEDGLYNPIEPIVEFPIGYISQIKFENFLAQTSPLFGDALKAFTAATTDRETQRGQVILQTSGTATSVAAASQ